MARLKYLLKYRKQLPVHRKRVARGGFSKLIADIPAPVKGFEWIEEAFWDLVNLAGCRSDGVVSVTAPDVTAWLDSAGVRSSPARLRIMSMMGEMNRVHVEHQVEQINLEAKA